jgi:small conductance mechanosensitive channel
MDRAGAASMDAIVPIQGGPVSFNFSSFNLEARAITIGSALLILVFGWVLASWSASAVRKATQRSGRLSPTLVPLFYKLTRLSLLLVATMAALEKLGVQTSGLFAVIGAAGLAIGLALKDTVSDVAAGVVLLVLRPFDVGEAVDIGGTGGVVSAIDFMQTKLTSFDGIPIVLNNSAVRTAIIQNFSRAQTRRIDLEIGIGYGDDIGKAKAAIEDVLNAEARVLEEPAILVNTIALGDSSVVLLARCTTKAADFWNTKLDLIRSIKERLDGVGISIPFPQRDVHLIKETAA